MPISERFSTSIGIIKSSSKLNEHYPCHPYWSTNKMEPKSDGRTSRITFIYFKFQNNEGQTLSGHKIEIYKTKQTSSGSLNTYIQGPSFAWRNVFK